MVYRPSWAWGLVKVLSSLAKGIADECQITQTTVCLNHHFYPDKVQENRASGVSIRILSKWKLMSGIGLIHTWWWLRRSKFHMSITLLFFADVIELLISVLSGIKLRVSSQESSNQHYTRLRCVIL